MEERLYLQKFEQLFNNPVVKEYDVFCYTKKLKSNFFKLKFTEKEVLDIFEKLYTYKGSRELIREIISLNESKFSETTKLQLINSFSNLSPTIAFIKLIKDKESDK